MINQGYKDLIVWQKSMELVVAVYELTGQYPKSELYNLTVHTRKTAISIPSNIAEGSRRSSKKDFRNFLVIAFGSGAELETQVELSRRLPFSENLDFTKTDNLLQEVMKMLNKMISNMALKTTDY